MKLLCKPAAVLLVTLFVLLSCDALAEMYVKDSWPGTNGIPVKGTIELSTGIRGDNLDWNIAGANGFPNVLSELTWTDVESVIFKGNLRLATRDGLYFRGYIDWGTVFDGTNQDSDYAGNDRTMEFSRSNNNADDGSVWDFSGGLGFVYHANYSLDVIPVAGFSVHKQNLTLSDGFQTIPLVGPFPGLDSTYRALWYGPWIGVDLLYSKERLSFGGTAELHYAGYRAEANWNLRPDLAHPKSFEHITDGLGLEFSLRADYNLDESWSVGGNFDARFWQTFSGTDRTFLVNGSIFNTDLNEVNWQSLAFMLNLDYSF